MVSCARATGVQRCPSKSLYRSWEEWPRLPFTARIGRAHRSIMLHPSSLAFTFSKKGGPIGLPLRASNEGLLRSRVARAQETNGPPLSPPFPAGASAEASPVSAESTLPCSPILTALNPAIGMPQVGSADPPEEGDGTDAGEQRDPESHTFIMRSRRTSDTDILRVRSQRDRRAIEAFAEMAALNRGVQVFAADLAHDRRRDDRQHLSTQCQCRLALLHREQYRMPCSCCADPMPHFS